MNGTTGLRLGLCAAVLIAPVAGTACHESPVSPVNRAVTVLTPLAWAASAVVFRVSGLTGADTLPVLVIGRDTVAVRFAAPDSLIAMAPDTQGTFAVYLGMRGRALLPAGSIQLAGGFSGVWTPPANIGGHSVPWPGSPQTSFAIALDSGLAIVDPRLHTLQRVLPRSAFDITCMNGAGPAARGRITAGTCGTTVALRPDSPSVAPDTDPIAGGRFAAELATGRWLVALHHGVSSYRRDSAAGWVTATTPYQVEEPYEVVVSPRGDRAVALGRDNAGIGMPVFGLASAEPVYLLAQYHRLAGAQFSANGDTLFVAAYLSLSDTAPVLAALNASDGAVLASAPAWSGAYHVVLDPGRPWIYLVGHNSGFDPPSLRVYDRATFAPIATMAARVPEYLNGDAYPVFSPAERKLYLVETCSFCSAGPVPIFTFDLMP